MPLGCNLHPCSVHVPNFALAEGLGLMAGGNPACSLTGLRWLLHAGRLDIRAALESIPPQDIVAMQRTIEGHAHMLMYGRGDYTGDAFERQLESAVAGMR